MASNTGKKKYSILIEYDGYTKEPTGRIKPNIPSDPDYVAPVIDLIACPVTTTTTTTIGNRTIQVTFPEEMFLLNIRLKKGEDIEFTRTTAGNWLVQNLIYDSFIFEITGITDKYNIQVLYGNSEEQNFDVDNGQNWNVLLEGLFFNITQIIVTKYP